MNRFGHIFAFAAVCLMTFVGEPVMGADDTPGIRPAVTAKVYAQLPYAVTGMTVTINRQQRVRGETVTIVRGRLQADTAVTERHVIHCEAVDPDGNRPRYYTNNVSAPNGRFEIVLPLALDHAEDKWQLELTDVATGTTRTVTF